MQKDTVLTKSVEAGKHGCEVAAALHAELDSLRAQLASTESALACRKVLSLLSLLVQTYKY